MAIRREIDAALTRAVGFAYDARRRFPIVRRTPMITITALYAYPVKSCRGIALDRVTLTPAGFPHDREWMIVRGDGRFVTQREEPRLALIEPSLDAGTLELRAPGMSVLTLPREHAGESLEVRCWRDVCAAFDAGEEAARWLADFLGAPHRLVRFDARHRRPSAPAWTQGLEALNRFSDGFPWLLIGEASLQDLNDRLAVKGIARLPMNRFRPNIVLAGLPPYGEDEVHEFMIDGARLRVVKPCTRCIIPTTDQATGTRAGIEPLATLRQYRFEASLKGVLFGQNLVLAAGTGCELRVGQRVTATAR